VRVLVVGGRPLEQIALRALLSEHRERVVEAVQDAAAAVRAARERPPELVVLGEQFTPPQGSTLLAEIRRAAPDARVIVLGDERAPASVCEAFSEGASAYVALEHVPERLEDAIRGVLQGERYLDPAVGGRLFGRGGTHAGSGGLSAVDHELVGLLGLGHTNREAAELLGLSVRAVEWHRAKIRGALGLVTRADFVAHTHPDDGRR